jgi:polysaccharide biosynthesis/export protein
MQPARPGVWLWCTATSALLGMLLAPPSRAQAVLETPQQVNDHIRELSAGARAMPHDYVIGAGDLLGITVFDVQELSRDVRVSQTGTIGIPLIPVRLHVAGLTEMQTEQKIAEVLEANGLVTHADVSVSVKERKSKPITVVGAVAHPMVYQADRPVTILEVLAEAGGVANDAGDTVIVARTGQESQTDPLEPPSIGPEEPNYSTAPTGTTPPNGNPEAPSALSAASSAPNNALPASTGAEAGAKTPATPAEPPPLTNTITINLGELMENGDTKNNIVLEAGDVVTVPHAGIVYVLGAVNRAGGYVLANDRSQLSTLKILSLAGGLTRTAKSDKAVIVRKDDQGQHEVPIDLKKVLNRQSEDLQLRPSDVLYVPESAGKQAVFKAVEIGLAMGTAVAIYRLAYH